MSVKVLWVQQLVKHKVVEVLTTTSLGNKADLGTKSHPRKRLRQLLRANGLRQLGPTAEMDDDEEIEQVQAITGDMNSVQGLFTALAGLLGADSRR